MISLNCYKKIKVVLCMEMTLQLAQQIIEGAMEEAQKLNVKMVISIVDAGG